MRIELNIGSERIEVLDRDEVLEFDRFFHRDVRAVVEYLLAFLADPVNLSAIRGGLLEHGTDPALLRLDARELAQELARRIAAGRMEIRRPLQRYARRAQPAAAAAPPPKPAPPPPAPTPSEPPPEEALLAEVDPVAQAEALAQASESGAPLCDT
jgi:hypothetical protein